MLLVFDWYVGVSELQRKLEFEYLSSQVTASLFLLVPCWYEVLR